MDRVRSRLKLASAQDREAIRAILNAAGTSDAELIAGLQYQSKSTMEHWFGDDLDYIDILGRASDARYLGVAAMEDKVAEGVFSQYRDSLPPDKRAELDRDLEALRVKLGNDSQFRNIGGGLLAAQLLAQASGFGVFMMASSVVGGLTSAIGVTLPFAFYTSMSSMIALIIGPVGLAVTAFMVLGGLFRTNLSRTKAAIFHLARLRMALGAQHLVRVGSLDPSMWLSALNECRSVAAVETLQRECSDCESILQSPGFEYLVVTMESITKGSPDRWPALVPEEQSVVLARTALAHCRRLAPGRVDALYSLLLRDDASGAMSRLCLEEPDRSSTTYHAVYFRVIERILTLVNKNI